MKKHLIGTTITNGEGLRIEFVADIHVAENESELQLSKTDFYDRWRKSEWSYPHYEIEIIEPELGSHAHVLKFHMHLSVKKQTRFMCYVEGIPTLEDATARFKTWSLGSFYTMVTGEFFGPLFESLGNNHEAFAQKMIDEFGIRLVEMRADY